MKDILRITVAVLTTLGILWSFSRAAFFASWAGYVPLIAFLAISAMELSQLARYILNAGRHRLREKKRSMTGYYDNVKDPVSNRLFRKEHDRYDDAEMAKTFTSSYRPSPLKKDPVSGILFTLSGILSLIIFGMFITAASLSSTSLFFLYLFAMPYGIFQLLNTILMVDASLNLTNVPDEKNVPSSSLDQRMEEEIRQDVEAQDSLSPEELADLLHDPNTSKKQKRRN